MRILSGLLVGMLSLLSNQWEEVKIDPTLNTLQVDSTDWVYPWYVIKHSDHFENTFGEPITREDTAHIIRNSFCQVKTIRDTSDWSSRIPFARGVWKSDTLLLSIWQENASDIEELTLTVIDGKFASEYVTYYVFPYDKWEVKILEEELELSQMPSPGMPIKGRVSILLQEEIRRTEGPLHKMDTIIKRIEGTFVVE